MIEHLTNEQEEINSFQFALNNCAEIKVFINVQEDLLKAIIRAGSITFKYTNEFFTPFVNGLTSQKDLYTQFQEKELQSFLINTSQQDEFEFIQKQIENSISNNEYYEEEVVKSQKERLQETTFDQEELKQLSEKQERIMEKGRIEAEIEILTNRASSKQKEIGTLQQRIDHNQHRNYEFQSKKLTSSFSLSSQAQIEIYKQEIESLYQGQKLLNEEKQQFSVLVQEEQSVVQNNHHFLIAIQISKDLQNSWGMESDYFKRIKIELEALLGSTYLTDNDSISIILSDDSSDIKYQDVSRRQIILKDLLSYIKGSKCSTKQFNMNNCLYRVNYANRYGSLEKQPIIFFIFHGDSDYQDDSKFLIQAKGLQDSLKAVALHLNKKRSLNSLVDPINDSQNLAFKIETPLALVKGLEDIIMSQRRTKAKQISLGQNKRNIQDEISQNDFFINIKKQQIESLINMNADETPSLQDEEIKNAALKDQEELQILQNQLAEIQNKLQSKEASLEKLQNLMSLQSSELVKSKVVVKKEKEMQKPKLVDKQSATQFEELAHEFTKIYASKKAHFSKTLQETERLLNQSLIEASKLLKLNQEDKSKYTNDLASISSQIKELKSQLKAKKTFGQY